MKAFSKLALMGTLLIGSIAQAQPPRLPPAGPGGPAGRAGTITIDKVYSATVGQSRAVNKGTSSDAVYDIYVEQPPNANNGTSTPVTITNGSPNLQVVQAGQNFTVTDLYYNKGATLIMGTTRAHIKAAIESVPSGQTTVTQFIVAGFIDFSGTEGFLAVNKNVEFWGVNNAEFGGGTTASDLLKINGTNTIARFHNIKFSSYKSGSGYALVYANEEGPSIAEWWMDRCTFTCPNGSFNAVGASAWNGSQGTRMENLNFTQCRFEKIGRMPLEIHSHKNDGDVRIKYVNIIDCYFNGTGLGDQYGMCVSLSGDIQYVTGLNNRMYNFKYCGWELICTKSAVIGNTIMYSNVANTNGYSLTDGGNTEGQNNPGREPRDINIYGDNVNVAGRAFNCFYAVDVKLSNNKWTSTLFSQFQHAKKFDISDMNATSADQFTLRFEDFQSGNLRGIICNNTRVAGGGPLYEAMSFAYSSSKNYLNGIWIYTAKAADNGAYLKFDGGSQNRIRNAWYNDTGIADVN